MDPRPGRGGPAGTARAADRLRALLPARAGLPHRPIRSPGDLADGDFRKTNPRFQGRNFAHNLQIAEEVRQVAAKAGATPAQVALAWLLAKGDDIAPIPGTKRVSRVEENIAADTVQLTAGQLATLTRITPAPRPPQRRADAPARPWMTAWVTE